MKSVSLHPMKWFAFLVFSILLLSSCQERREVNFSFYAWRQDFEVTPQSEALLESLDVKKIYVKFADLVWDAERNLVRPEAVVSIQYPKTGYEIVPVVYIRNEVFGKTSGVQLDTLVLNLYQLIRGLSKSEHVNELQIDCDWTASTKENYFDFLKKMKVVDSQTVISTTIRLHQIRYKSKTGIPPVDKGVLMYYNMNSVENAGEVNTIFDRNTAEAYLDKLHEYPLPLDYALPVYGWCVQKRNGKVVDLLQTQLLKDFTNDSLMQLGENNTLVAKRGHFHRGFYFQEGDVLLEERVSPEMCLNAAHSMASFLETENVHVLFFELNHPNLDTYETNDFEEIRQALR
ncbi:MAG: hypothetical protein ACKVOK_05005 [Flavobacteriales bacterium]